jgi:hypothetical protein
MRYRAAKYEWFSVLKCWPIVNRVLATVVLLVATIAPVRAETFAYVPPADLNTPAPTHASGTLRLVQYAGQALDATLSGAVLHTGNALETNPQMKPFSHGGTATMLLGYALYDLVSGALQRRMKPAEKDAIAEQQILSNAEGSITTAHTASVIH